MKFRIQLYDKVTGDRTNKVVQGSNLRDVYTRYTDDTTSILWLKPVAGVSTHDDASHFHPIRFAQPLDKVRDHARNEVTHETPEWLCRWLQRVKDVFLSIRWRNKHETAYQVAEPPEPCFPSA